MKKWFNKTVAANGRSRFYAFGIKVASWNFKKHPRHADDAPMDLSPEEQAILRSVAPFTMTSPARQIYLMNMLSQLVANQVGGDIAECGVWRGGSMMLVARTLLRLNDTSRKLWLYDTFEGMSAPADHDRQADGQAAAALLEQDRPQTGNWCYASLEETRRNLLATGYPPENMIFVRGKVEDTIPATLPGRLALLRLDTDWYASTRHELAHLFPLLVKNGVLILDDYGHWQGARQATDEWLAGLARKTYLHRIDSSGRAVVKHWAAEKLL